MKKMMMIAVMIGALLMPAQISAQNVKRGEKKAKVVNVDKRGGKPGKKDSKFNKGKGNGKSNKKGGKNSHNVGYKHKPGHAPRPNVIINNCHHHAPILPPRPRPVVHHHHNCEAAGVVTAVVGLAALAALLAN